MEGITWIEEHENLLGEINDTVWRFAEVGLKEVRSAEFLAEILEQHGFCVERGIAGMETAFIARFGTDGPEIGLLAEYDALPELSQKVSEKKELEEACPDSGHGCGHNTLAAAIIGGALGIREEIACGNVRGKVTVFGCPAEELLIGKSKMAAAHVFESCDVLFSCHPNDVSYVWARTSSAVWSGTFEFLGKTAHAAIDPYNGRSALDAVELMDIGANYLREHVTTDTRIHYVITEGGKAPNVVPSKAAVWYTIRARDRNQVVELKRRIENQAKGAAVMSETEWKELPTSGCLDVLRNRRLEALLLESMKEVGAPAWTEKEYAFASALAENLPHSLVEQAEMDYRLSKEDMKQGLHTGIYDGFYREGQVMAVSTDVGDASWQVPTGVFSFASTIIGSPGHSWYYTACAGASIAHKGAVMAAKVLNTAVRKLLEQPERIQEVKESFLREKNGRDYQSLVF